MIATDSAFRHSKRVGRDCNHCVTIAYSLNKTNVTINMLDYIPGWDIVINFSHSMSCNKISV